MHKKMVKAVTGSLMAATMLATTATAFIPMSASAADTCLGQSNFDDGIGLPWHICVTNPAEQSFNIDGGSYNVKIVNQGGAAQGGESRWDCQFRHRSLHIEKGHHYKVHWEVTASNAGDLATQIATLDGQTLVWHNNYGFGTDGGKEWNNVQIKAGKNVFDSEFDAAQTFEVAEWAFHYGGAGAYQDHDCFPVGTELSFDNMSLECTTCGNKYVSEEKTPCLWDPTNEMGVITPRSDVRINQVGYWSNLTKKASYATDEQIADVTFKVVDSTGKEVYSGKATKNAFDPDSGEYVQELDFTECTATGEGFHIEVSDESNTYHNAKTDETYQMWKSHDFDIVNPKENNVYSGVLKNALNYYYQNRSGIPIEEAYITSTGPNASKSDLAHTRAGHTNDTAYVQSEWVKSYGQTFDGDKTYQIEATGGWYDAGDHGKYVVNGGISVWTLQNMYEMSVARKSADKWTGDTMLIPESGDNVPDILDETRVELEWMFKMMVSSKDPYWGKYENMVYHKMHDHKWTGLATKPWDYAGETLEDGSKGWNITRICKPPTYAASLNMAASAAQASRLWTDFDKTFADTCYENAKKAYKAVKDEGNYKTYNKNNPLFAPLDQAIGGGAYGDNYVLDDLYWAGCELYLTALERGDKEAAAEYYADIKTYKNTSTDSLGNKAPDEDEAFSICNLLIGGENSGSFTSFNWGCTAGLGTLSLYLNEDKLTEAEKTKVESSIVKAADTYIAKEEEQGMGLPYQGTSFTDPVNIGYEEDGVTPKRITGYEWGSNSFVVNNAIVMAYAYAIKGENKYISGVSSALDYIFGRNGLGVSYVTGTGTYHTTNPHHRYWSHELDSSFPYAPDGVMSGGCGSGLQDPYVGGLGYIRGEVAPQKCYVDSIEAWSVNEVTINWNAPFAWVISFLEDEIVEAPNPDENPTEDLKVTLWGDANVDGRVSIADAVVTLSYVSNSEKSPLSAQGILNADVYSNGDGLSAEDSLSIQRKLVNAISELPESYMN